MQSVIFIILLFSLYTDGSISQRRELVPQKPAKAKKPHFVFILTDDQDSEMDSLSAMPKLLSLVGDRGATFVNSFVTSPLGCPSRSSLLTGQYAHNHGTVNNSIEGGCCSQQWQKSFDYSTFPYHMNIEEEYATFFAGKYLNTYGKEEVGGLSYVPPGWTSWIGLGGDSVYYNYSLSLNGTSMSYGNESEDYLTSVLRDEAVNFIEEFEQDDPFFMMIATPACHSPFTTESQYNDSLNASFIPRTPNFNITNDNKNWFVQRGEPLSSELIDELDEIYRNRLRTLLSVDDMVESIVEALESRGFLNDTYIFFTSDNGYHLGQFSLHKDKRLPYEFDIRVPLLVRGPGIAEGILVEDVVTNIDLAPTILDLAQIHIPTAMDGVSFADSLLNETHLVPERSILIEYTGEEFDNYSENCEHLETGMAYCEKFFDCKCLDAKNNTYNCLRTIGTGKDELYCVWDDYDFEEYYNITSDPYQINNTIDTLSQIYLIDLQERLEDLMVCSRTDCNET